MSITARSLVGMVDRRGALLSIMLGNYTPSTILREEILGIETFREAQEEQITEWEGHLT